MGSGGWIRGESVPAQWGACFCADTLFGFIHDGLMRQRWLSLVLGFCCGMAHGADEKRREYRIEDAQDEFARALAPAKLAYQHAVAKALESADKIEIYLLDFEMVKGPEPDSLFTTW